MADLRKKLAGSYKTVPTTSLSSHSRYPQLGFLGSDDKTFASLPLRRIRGSNVAFGHQHCAHPALDLIGNEAQQGNRLCGGRSKSRARRESRRKHKPKATITEGGSGCRNKPKYSAGNSKNLKTIKCEK